MGNLRKEIGVRILAIRKKLKLRQEEFGEKISKSKAAISKYENGETYPPIETLLVIAGLADASLEYLISGKVAGNEPEKKPEITYPLAETEKNALQTAESLIERFGLDKRFQVVEIHHQPAQAEAMNEDEKQLLKAFRGLDHRRQERLLEDAEDMVLARKESHEKGHKAGGFSDQNCA